jgi:RecG-like helicase
MRTREKKRIVRMFLEGWTVQAIAYELIHVGLTMPRLSMMVVTVEVVLREALRGKRPC